LSTTEGEIVYFLFFLFVVAALGPVLIQKFWRCRPLENGHARKRIEALCKKANMKYADILYWPLFGGRMITAGVMGLVRRFRYILVTGSLLRLLEPDEIDAVIAHEIGHVKRNHLLFYLFFFVGYLLISYASFELIIFTIIYSKPVYSFAELTGMNQTTVISTVFSLLIIVLFLVYFRFIFGYFMRNFERQADVFVYELFGSAMPLISTFKKIAAHSGQSPDKPNWHHFSINERIGYLERCEADRSWIKRHDRKIIKSIAVYLAGVCLIGGIGLHLNYSDTGKRLSTHFFEKILLREIDRTPENANLYRFLGDLYYSEGKYDRTIWAYENSLTWNSADPTVLNNLAWLYATCEDVNYRRPERSLLLSEKAIELQSAPHVFDTLAESLFVNGRFEEAIMAERQALALDPENAEHYRKQLDKYVKAAGGP